VTPDTGQHLDVRLDPLARRHRASGRGAAIRIRSATRVPPSNLRLKFRETGSCPDRTKLGKPAGTGSLPPGSLGTYPLGARR
jgi:hypothetical protein